MPPSWSTRSRARSPTAAGTRAGGAPSWPASTRGRHAWPRSTRIFRGLDARDAVRRLTRRMGYEVRQFTPLRSLAAARRELFERRGIDVVLDVGANTGQYGALLRRDGYEGRLVSLEPLTEPYAALQRRAQADGAWTALQVAASDADGEVVLQVTEDSRSASVLRRNERFGDTHGWAPRGEER